MDALSAVQQEIEETEQELEEVRQHLNTLREAERVLGGRRPAKHVFEKMDRDEAEAKLAEWAKERESFLSTDAAQFIGDFNEARVLCSRLVKKRKIKKDGKGPRTGRGGMPPTKYKVLGRKRVVQEEKSEPKSNGNGDHLTTVWDKVKELGSRDFTVPLLVEETGLDRGVVGYHLKGLLEDGKIKKVGERKGTVGRPTGVFRRANPLTKEPAAPKSEVGDRVRKWFDEHPYGGDAATVAREVSAVEGEVQKVLDVATYVTDTGIRNGRRWYMPKKRHEVAIKIGEGVRPGRAL